MPRARPRKRPCGVCRKWFLPNPKLKERQETCANSECQREWHLKKCHEWNLQNKELSRQNYLQTKLNAALTGKPCTSKIDTGLPTKMVQELIGVPHLIIFQYLSQLILRRAFREIKKNAANKTRAP